MDVILQLVGARLFADFLAEHADIAAKWRQPDRIVGLATAHAPNPGRVTDRESDDADSETLRHREVSGFMYDD